MENLQVNIERLVRKINGVPCEAVGVYLRLYLLACHKTGDEIENGLVEIMGAEAVPKMLAEIFQLPEERVKAALGQLKVSGLVRLDPLAIVDFGDDNSAYLGRRRHGSAVGTANSSIDSSIPGSIDRTQVRKGKERKGEGAGRFDVSEFIIGVYQPIAHRFPSMPELLAAEECVTKYGKDKAGRAIATLAQGAYRLKPEHLAKAVRGEWDKPRAQQAAKTGRHHVDER
jgi:hypothetical protein